MLDPAALRLALNSHPIRQLSGDQLRPAAVLLPLLVRNDEDCLLFTRRTDLVRHHRGEISFPGGGREPADPDLVATALRETEEELGIAGDQIKLLGRLDDFISVHGYHVTPYVGQLQMPLRLRVDRGEIAEVIEVPLARLSAPGVWRKEHWPHRGRLHPVHFYTVDHHEIWGLTAAILRQFLKRSGLLGS